jgi:uncharacterized protein
MALKVNRVTNANIYVNGANWLGRAEEVKLPDINHMVSEHKALGMVGKVEMFSGIDKMEASIKWNSLYADVLKTAANPTEPFQLQVRTNIEQYEGNTRIAQEPGVYYITGQFKNVPTGTFKQHDNVELESKLTVWAVKFEVGGAAIYEVDVLNNIYKVDGEDLLADYRSNLGI